MVRQADTTLASLLAMTAQAIALQAQLPIAIVRLWWLKRQERGNNLDITHVNAELRGYHITGARLRSEITVAERIVDNLKGNQS